MTTNVVETESTTAVVTENDLTSVVEVTSAGPAGPPGGALTIQDEGVDEGLLTDKINFAGSTVSVVNDTEAEIATITVNAADPGANTNITSLGGITGGISSPDYVQFDTAAAAAGAVGRLLWNDTDGTLEFGLKGGNVTLQIGQEEVIRVTNTAGVTMTDGQAVYITGSTGNHLNVTLAQANAEATSSKTLAVVTETIANNNTGFATSSGLVRGLNTSALTEGAAIWLSPTVPGGLTSTKPVAPNHAVLIGWCVRQHASVGVIYVHIANGYELEELHNVLITAAANNQILRYDAATNLWKNATISPTLTLTGDVSGSATFTDLGNATLTATVADDSHNHIISNVDGLQDALDSKLPAASYTAADVLTKIKTVDGSGSGLDADLLDGQDGAHYLDFTNATNKPDPTITLAGDATGSVTLTDLTSGTLNVTVVDDSHNHVIANVDGLQDALDSKLAAASYTATDVLDKIKTVDGAGSGLDADLLDGQSSAYYTAINDRLGYTAENAANKGVAGGYASLDGAGLVPATQLPSYVDDVLEFANLASFPVTGETGKIYVAVDTAKTYRWSGSTYVEISASPGSTDAVPEGSSNLYFTTARARQSISAAGSLTYDNSTGVMSFTDAVTSVAGRTGDITLSTSDVSEGTNLYFTNARARSAISASGSLAYDSATGVVSYTTPNTDGIAEGTTNLYHTTARARGAVSAGTGISYNSSTGVITNAAPDQTVSITGSGTTTVTGTYPNFTVSSADQYVGTVTSVSGTGTVNGLTLTGSVTSSGSLTLGGTLSVDLSTATVTGTLPVTKGGTGVTSLTSGYLVKGNGTSAASASVVYDDGTNVGIATSSPLASVPLTIAANSANAIAQNIRGRSDGIGVLLFSDFSDVENGRLDFRTNYAEIRQARNAPLVLSTNATERMRINSSGNVGIGTSSPENRFQVSYTSTAPSLSSSAGAGLSLLGSSTLRVNIGSDPSSPFGGWIQATNGSGNSYPINLNPLGGNVGIGTSSPSEKLTVAGNFQLTTNSPEIRMLTSSGYGWRMTSDVSGTTAGVLAFQTTANNFGASTERMRIDSAGNVGIGTTSPARRLDVRGGDIQVSRAAAGVDGDAAVYFGNGGNNYIYGGSSTNLMVFAANGSERMRIDSAGNVGIGTSTVFGKFSVYGTTGFNADENAAISGSGSFKFRGVAAGTTITTYDYLNYTAMQFIRDNGNPTNTVGSITCTDGSTSYNTSSDRRLKKDIVPAGDAGAVIDAIEIVSHGWKASEGTVPFGVIAQDLHAVAPQAVHAGDDREEVEDVWGVDYSKLVPMLIKEVQSLRARVAELEGK